jgi:hypothetical protein
MSNCAELLIGTVNGTATLLPAADGSATIFTVKDPVWKALKLFMLAA